MRSRAQSSDGSRAVSMSSLPEDLLYHILKFVDENDDARCRAISQSWANLRRAWVLASNPLGPVSSVAFSCDGAHLAVDDDNCWCCSLAQGLTHHVGCMLQAKGGGPRAVEGDGLGKVA